MRHVIRALTAYSCRDSCGIGQKTTLTAFPLPVRVLCVSHLFSQVQYPAPGNPAIAWPQGVLQAAAYCGVPACCAVLAGGVAVEICGLYVAFKLPTGAA